MSNYIFVSSSIVIDIMFFISISDAATLLNDVAISAKILFLSSAILISLSSEEGTDATSSRRRLLGGVDISASSVLLVPALAVGCVAIS